MVVWLTALLTMVANPLPSDDLFNDLTCEKHIQHYDVYSVAVHAGEAKKQEIICPDRNISEIKLTTKINVLVLVTRYTFESRIQAKFDDQGMVEFYSFSKYNDDIAEWEGKREGNYFVINGRTGPLDNLPPPQERRFERKDFAFVNIDYFPYIAALVQEQLTFPVLNLWNGNLELHTVTPHGLVKCPSKRDQRCYEVYYKSPTREATQILNDIGMMVKSSGTDERGPYRTVERILEETPPPLVIERFKEPKPEKKKSWWWPFGGSNKKKETPAPSEKTPEKTPSSETSQP